MTAKTKYDTADEAFNTAYLKYTRDQESYQSYYDAVIENGDLLESARELAEGSMNATKALADALVATAGCVPSSICCQTPEVGGCFLLRDPRTTLLTTPSNTTHGCDETGWGGGGWVCQKLKQKRKRKNPPDRTKPKKTIGKCSFAPTSAYPALSKFPRFATETPTALWRLSSQPLPTFRSTSW